MGRLREAADTGLLSSSPVLMCVQCTALLIMIHGRLLSKDEDSVPLLIETGFNPETC